MSDVIKFEDQDGRVRFILGQNDKEPQTVEQDAVSETEMPVIDIVNELKKSDNKDK
jgi:hypothetical protein